MRERKVTRTIKTTEVKALCVINGIDELKEEEFTLTGHYKTDEEIIKALEKQTEGFKFIRVISSEAVSKLYKMTEADFVKYAVEA